MRLAPLHQRLLEFVRNAGQAEGLIAFEDVANEDCLAAARDLVVAGYLRGAFPPNPNMRDGIDWGYVIDPNRSRT